MSTVHWLHHKSLFRLVTHDSVLLRCFSDPISLARRARAFMRCWCTQFRNLTWIWERCCIKISYYLVDRRSSKASAIGCYRRSRRMSQRTWRLGWVECALIWWHCLSSLWPFFSDCCTARTSLLDMDGRIDSRVAWYIQKDVDIEAWVRRGGSTSSSPTNILRSSPVVSNVQQTPTTI